MQQREIFGSIFDCSMDYAHWQLGAVFAMIRGGVHRVLCVLRDAPVRALLSMRDVVDGIKEIPHLEEAARAAVSKDALHSTRAVTEGNCHGASA